ncbi:hypothetical protein CRV02_09600 [Arcobacter sp. CECT 8989]|uniref:methyl-accepting chemotaxis protein n=1 Tax=Arcobacter sp. CECT 8989 TaxID=2044509 RepID=UPI00100C0684|nr:methyl-accepting chemotaxis protein [Arcobacter sp. CECT 8989]RXK00616.1 hypothetical protein CRV02_09600 [Arcobacter sp. CECT 8989]
MKSFSINKKLIILIVGSLVFLSSAIVSISFFQSVENTEKDKLSQLKSITSAKKQHILDYFNSIEGLIVSVANSSSTIDALYYMEKNFYKIKEEVKTKLTVSDVKKQLISHYDEFYINNINFNIKSVEDKKDSESYLPKDESGIWAQYIYIVKNSAKIGEKNDMQDSSSISTSYTFDHSKFHNTFNTILKKFSLYDIFLVDNNGTIIYSTFKEKDFATNLKEGPYSNTGIAKANEKAYTLNEGEIAFSDFKPYEPSYNAPASFIATPVFKNEKRIGNLIMQFPINIIDGIMNFERKFDEAGLGETGNTYLVGSDYTMRNNHRYIDKNQNENVKNSGTTIATLKIETDSVKKALLGKVGSHLIKNENGNKILSAYAPLEVFGEKWAIISEIDDKEALNEIYNLNMLILSVVFILLIVIVTISLWLLKSSIVKPLKSFEEGLLEFFKYLNNETSSVNELTYIKNDEIGNMSKVINQNIKKIRMTLEKDRTLISETVQILSEYESGSLSGRIKTSTDNPTLNELKSVLNKMGENLQNNIDNILNTLGEYTHYNYLNKVDDTGLKEHLLKLANGVNTLGDSITEMLIQNKTNGIKLDRSSDVLLDSVGILSNNANSAAASIEETSASIEEINSNLVSSNENVQKMSSYAQEVTSSVKEGEELANRTTLAMDEINSQVTAINEAISVIDQIAFQTNILSLNAAVEAATAGESGKGFAVVAQEVRNLASRSAEAAKEIKDLVESANVKANEGKHIADSMIGGYSSLSKNISETIELIEYVSISSKEQQQGIAQINETIAKLDKQTQENASIAQETNEIAQETDKISKQIVSDANEKEFNGKDTIKVENIVNLEKKNKKQSMTEKNKIKQDDWESF